MGEKIIALILVVAACAIAAEGDDHWPKRQEAAAARVALDPGDAEAWTDLAEAALMRGDGVTAGSALAQVATLRGEDRRERFLSGCLALHERRYADGEAAFARAVELDPSLVEARFFQGRCCRYLGRLEEALDHFAQVIAARPAHLAARTYRIRVLQDLDRRHQRDEEIAALYALRQSGSVPSLTAASAFRRDRLVIEGVGFAVFERFLHDQVRWRVVGTLHGGRREVLVCRDGDGWMLAARSDATTHRLQRWSMLPDYDQLRMIWRATLGGPSWPPPGEPVDVSLSEERPVDPGH